jgi:hypothetical protein
MAEVPQDRIDAIRRYLQGEPASAICQALGRTRYYPSSVKLGSGCERFA